MSENRISVKKKQMCGINGIINQTFESDFSSKIHVMNLTLGHRGPDNSGRWSDLMNGVFLGQTRLSIIDLSSAGNQPMICPDSGNVIVYNGEVFNYEELNSKYLKGEKFKSTTDTETILKLYNKFGTDIFSEFDGMFALAIWDVKKESLLLARDLSGKKPLYFAGHEGVFSFSSELKGLFTLPWLSKEIDRKQLYNFLTFNFVQTPGTMFTGISKFEPGYVMEVNKRGVIRYEAFKTLQKIDYQGWREEELTAELTRILNSSVKRRMISDVPVGAFLSGGVDSSAIVGLMRAHSFGEIKTFTINFENEPNYSENVYAEKVAKQFGTTHYVKEVTKKDTVKFISTIADIYDEPQSDPTAVPIYFLSQMAAENGIKVVMNGDGPDELFAGYNSYARYAKLNNYYSFMQSLPIELRRFGSDMAGRWFPHTPFAEIASRLSRDEDLYWPCAGGVKEGDKQRLISDSMRSEFQDYSSFESLASLKSSFNYFTDKNNDDFISWMTYSGYKQAVIEKFLFRSDRLGMANSIEARSPFLSDEMVSFALSVPSEYKIRNGVTKYLLKKSLEPLLDNNVLYRKKMGFCFPIREWASETIVEYIESEFDGFNRAVDWFDSKEVKKQLDLLRTGNTSVTNNIWSIYFLMNWHKRWFNS